MHCSALVYRNRAWLSLLLAAGLVGLGLTWLALFGRLQGDGAGSGSPRLQGRQAPALVQHFSPQRLVAGLAPEYRDQAARP